VRLQQGNPYQLKEASFKAGEHASKIIRRALMKELKVIQKQGKSK